MLPHYLVKIIFEFHKLLFSRNHRVHMHIGTRNNIIIIFIHQEITEMKYET